jgi:hypothetical protein
VGVGGGDPVEMVGVAAVVELQGTTGPEVDVVVVVVACARG